jgi:lipopolysaccharide/colanic/teichoic acid biosynthesis glycosyltransferase
MIWRFMYASSAFRRLNAGTTLDSVSSWPASRYVGFFKRMRDSRFARFDTLVYSPLCLFLACLIIISVSS